MPATSVHVCKQKRVRTRTQAHLLQLERRGISAGAARMHRHCVRNNDGRAGMLLQANPGDLDELVVKRLQPCHVARLVPHHIISFVRGPKYWL